METQFSWDFFDYDVKEIIPGAAGKVPPAALHTLLVLKTSWSQQDDMFGTKLGLL